MVIPPSASNSEKERTLGCLLKFSYSFAYQLWRLFLHFDWFVLKIECTNVSTTTILIYRRDNFVDHHCGCTCTPIHHPKIQLKTKLIKTHPLFVKSTVVVFLLVVKAPHTLLLQESA